MELSSSLYKVVSSYSYTIRMGSSAFVSRAQNLFFAVGGGWPKLMLVVEKIMVTTTWLSASQKFSDLYDVWTVIAPCSIVTHSLHIDQRHCGHCRWRTLCFQFGVVLFLAVILTEQKTYYSEPSYSNVLTVWAVRSLKQCHSRYKANVTCVCSCQFTKNSNWKSLLRLWGAVRSAQAKPTLHSHHRPLQAVVSGIIQIVMVPKLSVSWGCVIETELGHSHDRVFKHKTVRVV